MKVSETFYSIQGEGATIGIPAVFLRLGGCNLTCGGPTSIRSGVIELGATWRCDTMDVWTQFTEYDPSELCDLWEDQGYVPYLEKGAHLVVTGGEPLIHNHHLTSFIRHFQGRFGFLPIIECETNGTIIPSDLFRDQVRFFNVSPKLSNSGMQRSKRIVPEVMIYFVSLAHAIFKFVVDTESDLKELKDDYLVPYKIPLNRLYLMPASHSRDQLLALEPKVVDWAKAIGCCYSTRLQLSVWDQATGV